jgi:hypothetical protein
MTSIPKIRKLGQTINMFNRGYSSFERALNAFEGKNASEYETALLGAARDVPDALEWALKIYLRNFPKLASADRRKLKEPRFDELITLMEQYADPPLSKETSIRLYGYREMRNESTHQGAIPSVDEVRDAIEGIRQIMLTYLPVEEEHLKRPDESKERGETGSADAHLESQRIKKLIDIHNDRLQKLRERQALCGWNTPPEISIEIEDIEAEIENLQTKLSVSLTASSIRLTQINPVIKSPPIESHNRLITIGRAPKNTVQVPDQEVSWEHGQIILMQGEYYYRHLSNINPSILRRKGEEYLLRPGKREDLPLRNQDRLTVGKITFVIEFDLIAEDAGYITTAKKTEEN